MGGICPPRRKLAMVPSPPLIAWFGAQGRAPGERAVLPERTRRPAGTDAPPPPPWTRSVPTSSWPKRSSDRSTISSWKSSKEGPPALVGGAGSTPLLGHALDVRAVSSAIDGPAPSSLSPPWPIGRSDARRGRGRAVPGRRGRTPRRLATRRPGRGGALLRFVVLRFAMSAHDPRGRVVADPPSSSLLDDVSFSLRAVSVTS